MPVNVNPYKMVEPLNGKTLVSYHVEEKPAASPLFYVSETSVFTVSRHRICALVPVSSQHESGAIFILYLPLIVVEERGSDSDIHLRYIILRSKTESEPWNQGSVRLSLFRFQETN